MLFADCKDKVKNQQSKTAAGTLLRLGQCWAVLLLKRYDKDVWLKWGEGVTLPRVISISFGLGSYRVSI
jgi:hypothetical protein